MGVGAGGRAVGVNKGEGIAVGPVVVAVAIPGPPGDAVIPGPLAAVGAAILATRVGTVFTVGVPDCSPKPHPVNMTAIAPTTASNHTPWARRSALFDRRVPCVTLLPLQYPASTPVRSD